MVVPPNRLNALACRAHCCQSLLSGEKAGIRERGLAGPARGLPWPTSWSTSHIVATRDKAFPSTAGTPYAHSRPRCFHILRRRILVFTAPAPRMGGCAFCLPRLGGSGWRAACLLRAGVGPHARSLGRLLHAASSFCPLCCICTFSDSSNLGHYMNTQGELETPPSAHAASRTHFLPSRSVSRCVPQGQHARFLRWPSVRPAASWLVDSLAPTDA